MKDPAAVLNDDGYLRQRIDPKAGDPDYLVLSDLLLAIKKMVPATRSSVLDYGAGGSPYRGLFGDCIYHRADLIGGANLDYAYGPDARLPDTLKNYDCVLSSQVLEHVEDPMAYLRECHRVLVPGGSLLLTTHGTFRDHGCPYDYWRWTVFGLRRSVERAGFKIVSMNKTTIGPRAALYLLETQLPALNFGKNGLKNLMLSAWVRFLHLFGTGRLHRAADKSLERCRVADADAFPDTIYICIALLAVRQ